MTTAPMKATYRVAIVKDDKPDAVHLCRMHMIAADDQRLLDSMNVLGCEHIPPAARKHVCDVCEKAGWNDEVQYEMRVLLGLLGGM